MSSAVPAFGGGPLLGSKWVRIAFLDESGVGNPEVEPITVVAGVVVYGDVDYVPLKTALDEIVASFPKEQKEKRFVHTAQLLGGFHPFTKANGWTETKRLDVLARLAQLPTEIGLPIVWGEFERARFKEDPRNVTNNESHYSHVMAAVNCTLQVERLMRENTPPNEICSIVMERREHTQKLLTDAQRFLSNPPDGFVKGNNRHWMPISRIIGTPHFEVKEDAGLLQMADFCALILKRRLMRDPRVDPFYEAIRPAIAFYRKQTEHPIS